ncbi:hypothetical protein XabCFBP2524_17505 [Xanthomonas axonopodis pv. begoniae]|nr:hypothetical protein XabCFBP2524_17505 [Xanthomonas axonopodis pv. begoniae]
MDGLPITSATKCSGINTCLKQCVPISSSNLESAVSRPGRDRVAAWMPPPSIHGRIHGVSRHWMRHRAADRLWMPTSAAHDIRRFHASASVE